MGDAKAWKVAAALAHACGLDWGTWAKGVDGPDECNCGNVEHAAWCLSRFNTTRPVPDPSDVDAYRADCRRRDVEPGPLPSLEYKSGYVDVEWSVFAIPDILVKIGVGGYAILKRDNDQWDEASGTGPFTNLVRAVELARVAAEAMR